MDCQLEKVAKKVLDTAYGIHTKFGSGLLENAYQIILATELRKFGFKVETEKDCSFSYNGTDYHHAYRIDMLINDELILELKSCKEMSQVFAKQLLTYLRLSGHRLGFVINFGMDSLKHGIVRVVNHY